MNDSGILLRSAMLVLAICIAFVIGFYRSAQKDTKRTRKPRVAEIMGSVGGGAIGVVLFAGGFFVGDDVMMLVFGVTLVIGVLFLLIGVADHHLNNQKQ